MDVPKQNFIEFCNNFRKLKRIVVILPSNINEVP